MIPIPKFRLGTIFLLFFCYAIGLAMTRDLLGAVEPAIAVAILVGLSQQVRQLWRWNPPPSPPRASFAFARRFAIFWRCVVCLTLFENLAVEFIRQALPNLLGYYAYDGSLVSSNFPPIYTLCILLVLCNSCERWRPKTPRAAPVRRTRWLVLVALPIATIVVLQETFLQFLVHQALASIEASQSARFQRPGVYITPVDENLFSFWIGSLAILGLIAGAIVLLRFIRRRNFTSASLWNLAIVAPLLTTSAIFSAWFFKYKFQVFSPDMFGNGLEATRDDWIFGCIFGSFAAATVAHRIARSEEFGDPPVVDVEKEPEAIPFHQTPLILCLIGLSGLRNAFVLGQIVDFATGAPIANALWYALVSTFSSPFMLMLVAQVIASVQVCWLRWKYREHPVSWQLAALSLSAWCEGFFATLVLLAIGIPTLHAFSVVCWLMPWNVKALFGF